VRLDVTTEAEQKTPYVVRSLCGDSLGKYNSRRLMFVRRSLEVYRKKKKPMRGEHNSMCCSLCGTAFNVFIISGLRLLRAPMHLIEFFRFRPGSWHLVVICGQPASYCVIRLGLVYLEFIVVSLVSAIGDCRG